MGKISFSLLIGTILVLASCESGSNGSGTTETWNDSDSTVTRSNSVQVHSYPGDALVIIVHHTTEESSRPSNSSSESYSHPHLYSHPIPIHISHPVHISHH